MALSSTSCILIDGETGCDFQESSFLRFLLVKPALLLLFAFAHLPAAIANPLQ